MLNPSQRFHRSRSFVLALMILPFPQNSVCAVASDDTLNLVNEAYSEICSENFESAIQKLEEVLKINPDNQLAKQNLSVACSQLAFKEYKKKNWADAAPILQKAINVNRKFDVNQGDIESLQRCYDYCISTLKRAKAEKEVIDSLAGEADDYLKECVPSRFSASRMPLHVYVSAGGSVPGFRPSFVSLFKQACTDWADASKDQVAFQFVNDSKNADIEVWWTDKRENAVSSGECGHAQIYPDENGIDRASIYLFTVPLDHVKAVTDRVMRVACLHELGHALGILGHSNDPRDIMTPSYQLKDGDTPEMIGLSLRDKNTILRLYSGKISLSGSSARVPSIGVVHPMDHRGQAVLLNNEAVALMNKKDYQASIEKLEAGLKLDENYRILKENMATAYFNWARQLCEQRKFAEAEADCKKALDLRQGLGQAKSAEYRSILQCLIYSLQQSNKIDEMHKAEAALRQAGG